MAGAVTSTFLTRVTGRLRPRLTAEPAAADLQGYTRARRAADAALRAAPAETLQACRATHKDGRVVRGARWECARYDRRYMCIPPEQWKPLSEVSLEVH